MKIIDKRGRLFGLVNIIDLFITVILIALIGFGAYKIFKVNPTVAVDTEKITMVYMFQEVRDVTYNAIEEGEIAKDYDKNSVYGKIVKKEAVPATRLVNTDDGRVVEAEVPERFDVKIYIEGNAVISNTGVYMGNQEIRIGSPLGGIKGK
ncbi:DUF4330 domain-containing protein, partial [Lutispora sp.]|uniref:DUF4330 domain-containing protein n=1 Tax=Lutispora sp. TaxID=2828727 RepID=UPI003563EE5C